MFFANPVSVYTGRVFFSFFLDKTLFLSFFFNVERVFFLFALKSFFINSRLCKRDFHPRCQCYYAAALVFQTAAWWLPGDLTESKN